jgi:release factor H-coupled RctB family protein
MTVTVDQLPVNLAYGPVTRSFAELLRVSEVVDEARVEALGMDVKTVAVLVHSGSRGLGESILRGHTDRRGAEPLPATSDEGRVYLGRHDGAVRWARVNRALIAERMLAALGCAAHRVLDVCHNSVEAYPAEGEDVWLHRKGAVPADRGAVVIPGSRGDHSYLVEPLGDGRINLHSLAHGAGRKWQRSAAKGKLGAKADPAKLRRTRLGSRVICEDKSLLFEEAPEAYKPIEQVIAPLARAGALRVLAVLTPLLTYKTRQR